MLCADTQRAFSLSFIPTLTLAGLFRPSRYENTLARWWAATVDHNGAQTRGAEQGHPWGTVSKISGAVARVWENYGPPD